MRRLLERYRFPESLLPPSPQLGPLEPKGFFQLNDGIICYGSLSSGQPAPSVDGTLPIISDTASLPYDPDQLVENLLLERYPLSAMQRHPLAPLVRPIYYTLRPLLPVSIRKHLQRLYVSGWQELPFPAWPVDFTVEHLHERHLAVLMESQGLDTLPFIWFWPDGYESCVMLTHDIESRRGKQFCSALMEIDEAYGVSASFQIIPESRYPVTPAFLDSIRQRGFEINVHDLNHDGNLFATKEQFLHRVRAINDYGRTFRSAGFRSGAMYRNQAWFHALEFEYDMSVPNVAHLEAQQGGCCTVFPYFMGDLLELPLTTTQDYALVNLMQQHSLDHWKLQIGMIRAHHGLISILVHPDYIQHSREQELYRSLLAYLVELQCDHNVLIATPDEVNTWWRTRNQLSLVRDGSEWKIVGRGCERAQLAFACREGNAIAYKLNGKFLPRGSGSRNFTEVPG